MEGIAIKSPAQLRNAIGLTPVGQEVELTHERKGSSRLSHAKLTFRRIRSLGEACDGANFTEQARRSTISHRKNTSERASYEQLCEIARRLYVGVRGHAVDLHGNPHSHNLPTLLVSDLDPHVPGISLWEPIAPDLRRCPGSLMFGSVEAYEIKPSVIAGEAASFPHVEIEARHWFLHHEGAYQLQRRGFVRFNSWNFPARNLC